jgi:hypothetical protein
MVPKIHQNHIIIARSEIPYFTGTDVRRKPRVQNASICSLSTYKTLSSTSCTTMAMRFFLLFLAGVSFVGAFAPRHLAAPTRSKTSLSAGPEVVAAAVTTDMEAARGKQTQSLQVEASLSSISLTSYLLRKVLSSFGSSAPAVEPVLPSTHFLACMTTSERFRA